MKEVETIDTGASRKKRELCIGKKPHEYKLIIPHLKYTKYSNDDIPDKVIKLWYEFRDLEYKLNQKRIITFKNLGYDFGSYGVNQIKEYKCERCGKILTEF